MGWCVTVAVFSIGVVACGADSDPADESAVDAGALGGAAKDVGADTGPPLSSLCAAGLEEGSQIGQIPHNATPRNCNGVETSLHSLACGNRLTLIDIGTGSMAPCLQATDVYVTSPDYAKMRTEGLQIIQIFRTDGLGEPPTSAYCEEFVDNHAVDFPFLVDPLEKTKPLAPWSQMPMNLILDHEGRIIERWAVDIPDTKLVRIQELLAAQPLLD